MDIEHIHLPGSLRTVELSESATADRSGGGSRNGVGGGRNDAHDAATAASSTAAFAELFSGFKTQLQELERRRQQSLWEMQIAALELAVAAASQLLMKGITAGDYAIEEVVRSVIGQLEPRSPIVITLHPADRQLLEQRLAKLPAAVLPEGCDIRTDSRLKRGDCRAELADGAGLVREAAAMLNDIHRAWLEELDEAQIERRQNDPSGHQLQRFPDRRETA